MATFHSMHEYRNSVHYNYSDQINAPFLLSVLWQVLDIQPLQWSNTIISRKVSKAFTWEYPVGNPGWHWAPPCWSVQCTVGWSGSNHYACPCLLKNQTGRVRKYAENPAAQSEMWCTNGKRVSECQALRKRLKKKHHWSNTKSYWSRAS